MKVLVACLEDRSFEFIVDVGQLNQSTAWPHFWMPCVMGDDWFQRANCPVRAAPVDTRLLEGNMFVLYQARQDAEAFAAWIPEALAAVQHGYRTMRG